jgi:hypothetical protein
MTANIESALVTVVDDAFFSVTASTRLDPEALAALGRRRAGAIVTALRNAAPQGLDLGEPWLLPLCAAIAPIAPPWWLPMAQVVSDLSLEHGARGVRSLFTRKPSDKEVARVRRVGSLAVRILGSALAAVGKFDADARLLRATLVASLGLPEDDQRLLNTEQPMAPEALGVFDDVEPKIARSIVRGAFQAAASDGLDPREEQAIALVAQKLGLGLDDLNTARSEARAAIDQTKAFGAACVDAIRYVLVDEPAQSELLAAAAARLTLPALHRGEVIRALALGGAVALGRKHSFDRRERDAVLALAWLSSIRCNPTVARRAALALRHDDLAIDQGAPDGGAAEIRSTLDRHVELEILSALRATS